MLETVCGVGKSFILSICIIRQGSCARAHYGKSVLLLPVRAFFLKQSCLGRFDSCPK